MCALNHNTTRIPAQKIKTKKGKDVDPPTLVYRALTHPADVEAAEFCAMLFVEVYAGLIFRLRRERWRN